MRTDCSVAGVEVDIAVSVGQTSCPLVAERRSLRSAAGMEVEERSGGHQDYTCCTCSVEVAATLHLRGKNAFAWMHMLLIALVPEQRRLAAVFACLCTCCGVMDSDSV